MRAGKQRLRRNRRGAVAPTVAVSLFALIGMGGIAFDYAHLANLDTELQQAADQAALAAATQLDGSDGARARATAAAQSLLYNSTFFASDGATDAAGRKVTIATVEFFQSYNEATDVYGAAATDDEDARVVRVSVGGRRADYALTPVVGVITSGTINAQALASLASAVCNVPPMMMCVPDPAVEFPTSAHVGIGVQLQPGPNVGFWVPGDYGYLDFGDGASGLQTNLGRNSETAGCLDMSSGIPTEPGNKASVTSALNSRFDLYPVASTNCNPSTGDFCPSENTHKDLAKTYEAEVNGQAPGPGVVPPPNPFDANCTAPGMKLINTNNQQDQAGLSLPGTSAAQPPGLTRDICHIAASCGKFGNGNWDRNAYLGPTHGTDAATVAGAVGKTSATLTRWDVYQWELANKAARLATKSIDITPNPIPFKAQGQSGNGKYTFTNRCTFPQPTNGTAVPAGANQKDRRVLTVAAVDCTGLNGKGNIHVKKWVDVFLVEPSLTRTTPNSPYATDKEQIYVEIIGAANRPNGQSAYQYYLRQRPRLLR